LVYNLALFGRLVLHQKVGSFGNGGFVRAAFFVFGPFLPRLFVYTLWRYTPFIYG
jgi:hypothetical protein